MLGLYISGTIDEFADEIKELVTVYSYDFEVSKMALQMKTDWLMVHLSVWELWQT